MLRSPHPVRTRLWMGVGLGEFLLSHIDVHFVYSDGSVASGHRI